MKAGRMFICSARVIGNDPGVISSPSTLAPKRLPGRKLSEDKRLIADLRGANNFTRKEDYHAAVVPIIETLENRIGMLRRRFPGKN